MPFPKVAVTVVTFHSERYIGRCLDALFSQQEVDLEVVVVDNASTDGTCHILSDRQRWPASRLQIIPSERNLGFAAAQNLAIQATNAPWVLTLNPDVLLRPGFIAALVDVARSDPRAGTVCGKLLSIGPGFEPLPEARIDSTGLFFTPAMRHFDRGWHEPDGRYSAGPEYVFGACAAAALFRREMIDDVAIDGHFFDPDFFVYREDADVAWRAQLFGWRCIYTPVAEAFHVRTVTPLNRRSQPPAINMHSVKNRFLMRIKNATGGVCRRCWLPMATRDLLVLGGSLFYEPHSIRAWWHVARCLPRALRQRRIIMARRRVPDEELTEWFSPVPVAFPAGRPALPSAHRASRGAPHTRAAAAAPEHGLSGPTV